MCTCAASQVCTCAASLNNNWHEVIDDAQPDMGVNGPGVACDRQLCLSACQAFVIAAFPGSHSHCRYRTKPYVSGTLCCVFVCCAVCVAVLFQDKLDTIRLLVIGVSAHQKLELLERLVTQLGFDTLTVFGDCFDEVRQGGAQPATLTLSILVKLHADHCVRDREGGAARDWYDSRGCTLQVFCGQG